MAQADEQRGENDPRKRAGKEERVARVERISEEWECEREHDGLDDRSGHARGVARDPGRRTGDRHRELLRGAMRTTTGRVRHLVRFAPRRRWLHAGRQGRLGHWTTGSSLSSASRSSSAVPLKLSPPLPVRVPDADHTTRFVATSTTCTETPTAGSPSRPPL